MRKVTYTPSMSSCFIPSILSFVLLPLAFSVSTLLCILPRESFPHHPCLLLPPPLSACSLSVSRSLFLLSLNPSLPQSCSLSVSSSIRAAQGKKSQHALLKPVVCCFLIFFHLLLLFSTLITAIKTNTPLLLRPPTPTSSCSECALD